MYVAFVCKTVCVVVQVIVLLTSWDCCSAGFLCTCTFTIGSTGCVPLNQHEIAGCEQKFIAYIERGLVLMTN